MSTPPSDETRLRTLQLIDSLDSETGGPVVSSQGLGQSLAAAGCNAEMVTMRPRTGSHQLTTYVPGDLMVSSFPAIRVGGRSFSISFAASVFKKARHADVILIHGFYLWHVLVGGLAALAFRKVLVVHPHGVFERYQQQQSKKSKAVFNLLIGRWVLRRADAVVVASESEVEGAADLVARDRVHVVSHGVAAESKPPRDHWHTPLRLLSLSRVAEKKRIDISIKALGVLRESGREAVLTVGGTGDSEFVSSLVALASEEGVSESVTFVGHLDADAKCEAISASDLLLLPSENENFAMAVAEALADGLPCVVTEAVALSAKIENRGGRVIKEPDAKLLADAIIDLTSDDEAYKSASAEANRIAVNELSWASSARDWLDAVEPLVGRRRRA